MLLGQVQSYWMQSLWKSHVVLVALDSLYLQLLRAYTLGPEIVVGSTNWLYITYIMECGAEYHSACEIFENHSTPVRPNEDIENLIDRKQLQHLTKMKTCQILKIFEWQQRWLCMCREKKLKSKHGTDMYTYMHKN